MVERYRGGPFYVVNFRTMEFLRTAVENSGKYRVVAVGAVYATWTPRVRRAMGYRDPSRAAAVAARINAETGRRDCQGVTRAAAECVDEINRRDGLPGRG